MKTQFKTIMQIGSILMLSSIIAGCSTTNSDSHVIANGDSLRVYDEMDKKAQTQDSLEKSFYRTNFEKYYGVYKLINLGTFPKYDQHIQGVFRGENLSISFKYDYNDSLLYTENFWVSHNKGITGDRWECFVEFKNDSILFIKPKSKESNKSEYFIKIEEDKYFVNLYLSYNIENLIGRRFNNTPGNSSQTIYKDGSERLVLVAPKEKWSQGKIHSLSELKDQDTLGSMMWRFRDGLMD